jgi:hypothetical protein
MLTETDKIIVRLSSMIFMLETQLKELVEQKKALEAEIAKTTE